MKRPQPSGSSPTQPDSQIVDVEEFERSLADVEQALIDLKQRYTQVQQDLGRQSELRRLEQIKQESRLPQLKTELRQIREQLEAIEINLESRLFSWGSLREPFWQAVRFGGLGVVVGWILKYLAG